MNLKNAIQSFFGDEGDRAVSPVIGVILMVAITVILAAVIGTFVLGLGDRVSEAQPNANFGFDYHTAGNNDYVNVTHDGGEGVQSSQVNVSVGGTTAWGDGTGQGTFTAVTNWEGKLTAGSTVELKSASDISDGDTVKVIWKASGSDKTAVIGESDVSL